MHDARVHTRTLKTPGEPLTAEEERQREQKRLVQRREYQHKLRDRYKREGKDSRGYPLHNRAAQQWTPAQRRKFQATVAAKQEKRLAQPATGKKRIQIVYPDPQGSQTEPEPMSGLRYCPNCGTHLENWKNT
jgi:hypothetical protein